MKILWVVTLTLVSYSVSAQKSEVGLGLGTLNYTGDLARTYNILNSKPAGTVFFRSNVSRVVSLRAALTLGGIGASDRRKPIDAFAERRDASFDIFMIEGSAVAEYHFLNWREERRFMRFTPYLFGGLALFGFSGNQTKTAEYSNVQGSIPFGAGVKYIINPKWYLSLEFGARKTFFDYLDNVSVGTSRLVKDYRYGNPNDNDAYYFLGLSITRTFYEIPCPTNPYK